MIIGEDDVGTYCYYSMKDLETGHVVTDVYYNFDPGADNFTHFQRSFDRFNSYTKMNRISFATEEVVKYILEN